MLRNQKLSTTGEPSSTTTTDDDAASHFLIADDASVAANANHESAASRLEFNESQMLTIGAAVGTAVFLAAAGTGLQWALHRGLGSGLVADAEIASDALTTGKTKNQSRIAWQQRMHAESMVSSGSAAMNAQRRASGVRVAAGALGIATAFVALTAVGAGTLLKYGTGVASIRDLPARLSSPVASRANRDVQPMESATESGS